MTLFPLSPCRVRHLALLLMAWPASAQPSNIAILPPRPRPLGFLTRAYQQRTVPAVNLTNSGRLSGLIRSGSLYLSARDVVAACALEKPNIDIENPALTAADGAPGYRTCPVGGALQVALDATSRPDRNR